LVSRYDEEASDKCGCSPEEVDERELNEVAIFRIEAEATIVHLTESVCEAELEQAKCGISSQAI